MTKTAKIYKFAKIFRDGDEWIVVERRQNDINEWYWGFHSMHDSKEHAKVEFRRLVLSPQLK